MTMSMTTGSVNSVLGAPLEESTRAAVSKPEGEVSCLSVAAVMAVAAYVGAEAGVDIAVGGSATAITALAV